MQLKECTELSSFSSYFSLSRNDTSGQKHIAAVLSNGRIDKIELQNACVIFLAHVWIYVRHLRCMNFPLCWTVIF